jgi:hypothetical protein
MASLATTRSFKNLQIPASLGFGLKARYTPVENVPALSDHRLLVDRYSPKRAAVSDRYSRLPPDRLCWRVISNISFKEIGKAVLRNRIKRRWASAFAEALKDHGYYHNGRKRSGPADGKHYVTGLTGTLEILIFSNRGLTCGHHELVVASRNVVKALNRKMQLDANSKQAKEPKTNSKPSKESKMQDDADGSRADREVSSSVWSLWRKPL